MFNLELISQIREIRLTVSRLIEEQMTGQFGTQLSGRGVELREVREYQPGDDARTMDWNVTARTNHPHVKVFHPERQGSATILLDWSASVTQFWDRVQLAELCAVIATLAIANGTRIGVVSHSDQVEGSLEASASEFHVARIINHILMLQPGSRQTDLSRMLDAGFLHGSKHSMIFWISDLRSDIEPSRLHRLRHNHDCVIIRLNHEAEWQKLGIQRVYDSESGETMWIDYASRAFQSQDQQSTVKRQRELETTASLFGFKACTLELNSRPTETLVSELVGMFGKR